MADAVPYRAATHVGTGLWHISGQKRVTRDCRESIVCGLIWLSVSPGRDETQCNVTLVLPLPPPTDLTYSLSLI